MAKVDYASRGFERNREREDGGRDGRRGEHSGRDRRDDARDPHDN